MITILVDHNIEGQAALFWSTLNTAGWTDLLALRFVTFVQVGLPVASNDRVVWQFAQDQGMLLLTTNRNMDDPDSLEQTIRDANQPTSLPVLTIGNIDRMVDANYRSSVRHGWQKSRSIWRIIRVSDGCSFRKGQDTALLSNMCHYGTGRLGVIWLFDQSKLKRITK